MALIPQISGVVSFCGEVTSQESITLNVAIGYYHSKIQLKVDSQLYTPGLSSGDIVNIYLSTYLNLENLLIGDRIQVNAFPIAARGLNEKCTEFECESWRKL